MTKPRNKPGFYGLSIPKKYAEVLGISRGDEVLVVFYNNTIEIRKLVYEHES